jgi:hypothetical protein
VDVLGNPDSQEPPRAALFDIGAAGTLEDAIDNVTSLLGGLRDLKEGQMTPGGIQAIGGLLLAVVVRGSPEAPAGQVSPVVGRLLRALPPGCKVKLAEVLEGRGFPDLARRLFPEVRGVAQVARALRSRSPAEQLDKLRAEVVRNAAQRDKVDTAVLNQTMDWLGDRIKKPGVSLRKALEDQMGVLVRMKDDPRLKKNAALGLRSVQANFQLEACKKIKAMMDSMGL